MPFTGTMNEKVGSNPDPDVDEKKPAECESNKGVTTTRSIGESDINLEGHMLRKANKN